MKHDLIYVAQLIERKCPMFVVEVMRLLPDVSIRIIGDGPLRKRMLDALETNSVKYTYTPRVKFDLMPKEFANAKICLLPTLLDPWGLVANEAIAEGCAVITTKEAGCAEDLVIHRRNGFVLPLVARPWAFYIRFVLSGHYHLNIEMPYNREDSAERIRCAVRRAMQ